MQTATSLAFFILTWFAYVQHADKSPAFHETWKFIPVFTEFAAKSYYE
jgi:hypothetical protein